MVEIRLIRLFKNGRVYRNSQLILSKPNIVVSSIEGRRRSHGN